MVEESVVKRKFIDYANKIIKKNKISHAYLFEINNYEQDLFYVYSFIKMILCNVKFEELDSCDNNIINLINSNNYPDLYVIKPEGSTIKKNQLLNLQKEYSNKSLLNNKRIYIIEECEKMNQSSANTILKFLEEPEEDVIAILLADNRYHVIETIISRCQIISLKDSFKLNEYTDEFIDFFECVLKPKEFYINYNNFIKNVIPEKSILTEFLNNINNILINYLNFKNNVNDNFSEDLLNLLSKYDDNYLIKIISIIEDEILKLNFNVNYKLWLDAFFAKLIIGG